MGKKRKIGNIILVIGTMLCVIFCPLLWMTLSMFLIYLFIMFFICISDLDFLKCIKYIVLILICVTPFVIGFKISSNYEWKSSEVVYADSYEGLSSEGHSSETVFVFVINGKVNNIPKSQINTIKYEDSVSIIKMNKKYNCNEYLEAIFFLFCDDNIKYNIALVKEGL